MSDDLISQSIRRELRSLSSQGFEVKDLGLKHLKGLENPEYIYLMYPHSLASRLVMQQQRAEAEAAATAAGTEAEAPRTQAQTLAFNKLNIDTGNLWKLYEVAMRLELLCSTLEITGAQTIREPSIDMMERLRSAMGDVVEHYLISFVELCVARIEVRFFPSFPFFPSNLFDVYTND